MGVDYFKSRIGLIKIVASEDNVELVAFVDEKDEKANANELTNFKNLLYEFYKERFF